MAWFAVLASGAIVLVTNIVAMGPTVIHILEEFLGGMLGPELKALFVQLFGVEVGIGAAVVGGGCGRFGEGLELLAQLLQFLGLGGQLVHEILVGDGEVG